MLLDIVILPPAYLRREIGAKVLKAARGIAFKYLVDNKKLIPHVSLFHLKTDKQGYERLGAIIKIISKNYNPIKIKNGIFEAPIAGYLWIRFSNTLDFKKLHRKVLLECHRLRRGMIPWIEKGSPDATQRKYRNLYGSSYVLNLLTPHITIGRPKIPSLQRVGEVVKRFGAKKIEFSANQIAICEVNRDCQVTKIFKTFKLKQAGA